MIIILCKTREKDMKISPGNIEVENGKRGYTNRFIMHGGSSDFLFFPDSHMKCTGYYSQSTFFIGFLKKNS